MFSGAPALASTALGYVKQIGNIKVDKINFSEIEKNPLRCPDIKVAKEMEEFIKQLKGEGETIGGVIEIVVKECPPGIGDPVFGKLDAYLSYALMSIGAIKGISIGEGFNVARLKGSENNDMLDKKGFLSNHAGGILGEISTGQDIIIQIAVKPTSSIYKSQKTITKNEIETEITTNGRHDPYICPRIVPVAEAMVALVLTDLIIA